MTTSNAFAFNQLTNFASLTLAQLAEKINNGIRVQVTCKPAVADLEGYLEGGMRATLIAAREDNPEVLQLTFDYSGFEEHNVHFETPNYFDLRGKPTLTARQAGKYKPQEAYYVSPDMQVSDLFEVLNAEQLELAEEYQKTRKQGQSYVTWLEDKLLAARNFTL